MKIVAVASCTSGMAHTYIAKEKLEFAAKEMGHVIIVETQGSIGVDNQLSEYDIETADAVLIASDIDIIGLERFKGKRTYSIPINKVVRLSNKIIEKINEDILSGE